MMRAEAVLVRVSRLDGETLERWVAMGWVRPERGAEGPLFDEADLARLRLILELRDEMDLGEEALPVVLNLLDQLHRTRAALRRALDALEDGGGRR